MKKIIALILAALTVSGTLSCTVTKRQTQTSSSSAASTTGGTDTGDTYELPATVGIMYIKGKEAAPEYVLRLDDITVGYGEFRYYYIYEKEYTENTVTVADMPTYWTEETEKALLDTVVDDLRKAHAVSAFAGELGIVLTDEDMEAVDERIDELFDYYGEDYFNAYFAEQHLDKETLRLLLADSRLQNNLFYYYYDKDTGTERWDDEKLKEYFEENYLSCKHILVKFPSGADDAAKAETLEKANGLYARAAAGEDFDKLVEEYGEDPGMTSNPDGYTFTEGTMVESFYEGTKALEIGGISEPIESVHGYHIIKRLPLTDEKMESVLEEMLYGDGSRSYGVYGDLFNEKAQEIADNYNPQITFNPDVEKYIRHDNVF